MTARRRVRAAMVLLALAATVGATAACGVRSDAEPRVLSAGAVPYGLLEDAPTTTTSAPTPSVPRDAVLVYFVKDDRMYSVVREVNAPTTVAKALTALLFGVQEDEVASLELRSAISPRAAIQARAIDPTTYLVDLSTEFAQGSTSEQVLGLAQIVYTATRIENVTGVRFTLNGAPIEVPLPDGSLTSGPIAVEHFADLAPLPPNLGGPPTPT